MKLLIYKKVSLFFVSLFFFTPFLYLICTEKMASSKHSNLKEKENETYRKHFEPNLRFNNKEDLFLGVKSSYHKICKEWSTPIKIGSLDVALINEASGLALSRKFSDRFYHINDRGDGPFFYVTHFNGENTKKIVLNSHAPFDLEDIALGTFKGISSIYLGDIGDNELIRSYIEIWIIKEVESFSQNVEILKKIILKYPDQAHNAEALSIDPLSGDLFILTKEVDHKNRRALPAMLFRVAAPLLEGSQPGKSVILEYRGQIDLPWLNYNYGLAGQIVTSMNISRDGEHLIILTYENAIEINFSLLTQPFFDSRKWGEGDYHILKWPIVTSQQEAITYSLDGNSLYFDTEFNPNEGDKEAPIFKMNCLNR